MSSDSKITVKNRKARHLYFIDEEIEAGIVLHGTEVKSVKAGNANFGDAWCPFIKNELYLKNAHIAAYKFGNQQNHQERRDRKLLLKKAELKKMRKKTEEKGYTVIPLNMFINDRGLIKVTIGLAKGKKSHDKRNTIKEKDQKRDMDRAMLG